MFSFFAKKSQNPDAPIIQGPSTDLQNNSADDFIFVEKKGERPEQPTPPQQPMYPHIPPTAYGGAPYPRFPYGPPPAGIPGGSPHHNAQQQNPVPYVSDVPFILAPQLCTKTTFENTQTQVDGILAFLTRQMSVDEHEDYSFALERSIQNESY